MKSSHIQTLIYSGIFALLFATLPTYKVYATNENSEQNSNTMLLDEPTTVEDELKRINQEITSAQQNSQTLPESLAELLVRKANILRKMSRHEEGKQVLDTLRDLASSNQLAYYLAQVDYQEGMRLKEIGEYKDAVPKFDAAQRQFAVLQEYVHQVRALRRAAYCLRSNGALQSAIDYAERALAIAKAHKLNKQAAYTLGGLANIYSSVGLYQEALEYDMEQSIYQPIENTTLEERANRFYAMAERHMRLEDYDSAKHYFHKALEIDLQFNMPAHIGHSLIKLSQVYRKAKEFDKALSFAQEAQVVFGEAKIERHIAWAKSNVGDVYLDQHQFEEAIQYLAPAVSTLTSLDEKPLLYRVKLSLAEAYLGNGNISDAEMILIESLAYANELDSHHTKLESLEGLIKLYEVKKDLQQAYKYQRLLFEEKSQRDAKMFSFRTVKHKNALEAKAKDAQIKILEAEKLRGELKLREETIQKQSAITAVVLLSVLLLIVLYVLYSRRKLANLRQAMLAESIERRNQLFADVSHELRTPLSVLKLQLQALEYGLISDKETTFSKLHEKIAEIDVLIDDIYQIACLEAQILTLDIQPILLTDWLSQISQDYAGLSSEKQLRFQAYVNVSPEVRFNADSIRLKQALMNVIRNSVKYTDSPGKTEFKAFIEGEQLTIVIQDSAPSVNKHELPKIFQRLYRADGTRGRDLGGSGLGLTIAKSIIELHGGSIRAEASELGGLQVNIYLPLREQARHEDVE